MTSDLNSEQKTYVDIRGMSFYRGDRAIFSNVDIKIPKGKITAVMGPRNRENHIITPDWWSIKPTSCGK